MPKLDHRWPFSWPLPHFQGRPGTGLNRFKEAYTRVLTYETTPVVRRAPPETEKLLYPLLFGGPNGPFYHFWHFLIQVAVLRLKPAVTLL
jgi:hypothetical protein